MIYLKTVSDLTDLKNQYRAFCKTLHPDKGGSKEAMQVLNAEYEHWTHHFTAGAGADASSYGEDKFWATPENHAQVEEMLREAIEKVAHLEGLEFEMIGAWVWVSGATKTHKTELKDAGYKWHFTREKWFFAGVESRGRGNKSMDELREKYGSSTIRPDGGKRQLKSA
ncbi:molecular chaperone DnaJ [Deinococcus cellulosilyticus]|uniref:Molecular chaperone DnaJ n=1 Tax=Deinococcus cellulosilyticus (strain DSM 18568 / NBRC 106333 / KACC 11606 / 5516J-15) TaxID=1223518 RepID=A0A511NA34_DEIC1|nr:molecular chaperone DnaJ [Deinococcus cellulosilyticus]GEM49660.1 hypothetical protein DC3_52950 [Deinococcus cellulosilyticus NBRC 106333 = KACC 11606]